MHMPLRVVPKGNPELDTLIDWFLRYDGEARSIDCLHENLGTVLSMPLFAKQLDIVLNHTAKAIDANVYGDSIDRKHAAQRIVAQHIPRWTDAFIKGFSKSDPKEKRVIGRDIAEATCGFRFLELQPPARFSLFVQNKAAEHMQDFSADNFAYLLSNLGQLALPLDEKFLSATYARAQKLIPSFSPDEAIDVLHSLAVIDSVQKTHRLPQNDGLKKTFESLLNDNRIRAKLAQLQGHEQEVMQRKLLDAVYWFQGKDIVKKYPTSADTPSLFEEDAKSAFEGSNAKSLPTSPHPVTGKRPDLRGLFSGKAFIVECDGPTHFLHTSEGHCSVLNGRTIFQTALQLKRESYTPVLRLPWDLFYANRGDKGFFDAILGNLISAKNCGYVVGQGGILIPLTKGYALPLSEEPNPSVPTADPH